MNEFETRVLDGLQGLTERMVRVETKLDRLDAHEVRLTSLEQAVPNQDHESRLRQLERAIWIASGTALAGGGVLGTILSNVTGV